MKDLLLLGLLIACLSLMVKFASAGENLLQNKDLLRAVSKTEPAVQISKHVEKTYPELAVLSPVVSGKIGTSGIKSGDGWRPDIDYKFNGEIVTKISYKVEF